MSESEVHIYDLRTHNVIVGFFEGKVQIKVRSHYGDLKLLRPLVNYRYVIEGETAIIKNKDTSLLSVGVVSE